MLYAELSSILSDFKSPGEDASNLYLSEQPTCFLLLGVMGKLFPTKSLNQKIIPHYGHLESPESSQNKFWYPSQLKYGEPSLK